MARTVNPEAHARRRAEIVAAAAVEFAADGVDGTSTARICRRAGIGSGTLFHYFGTKQEIFRAVFADDLPRLTELCDRATATPDPDAGLGLLVDHLVEEISSPLAPGLASAALLQSNRDPELARVLAVNDATVRRALTAVLERLAEDRALAFAPAAVAGWIQALVDAGHLGLVDGAPDDAVRQLRLMIGWLVGRA